MRPGQLNVYKVKLSYVLMVVFVVFLILAKYLNLRALLYLTPVCLPLLFVFKPSIRISQNIKPYVAITIFWLIIFVSQNIINPTLNTTFLVRSVKELGLLIMPLVSLLILSNFMNLSYFKKLLNVFLVGFLILETLRNGVDISILFNPIGFLINSETQTESTYALVYGAMVIFFLTSNQKIKAVLSFYLVLIGGKRIVILALVVILLIYFPLKYIYQKYGQKLILTLIIFGNVIFLVFFLSFTFGIFDNLIQDLTGLPAQTFTKGRSSIYKAVFDNTSYISIIGSGIGYSSYLLEQLGMHLTLMHSDLLKLYVETGVIGFLVFLVLFYRLGIKNHMSMAMLIYFNVLMITGNPLIYFHITLPTFIILYTLNSDEEKHSSNLSQKIWDTPNN